MELSERSTGYKKMVEFINELDITSCEDPNHLKMYKNIKTALTFVSSDMFGYLCNDEQIEIADNHWTEYLIDRNSNVIHLGNVADILLNANHIMHPSYDSKFGVSYYGDRWLNVHRVFANTLAPLDADDGKHASDEFIRFEGAVIIYKTMDSVAKDILKKASHKKVKAYVTMTQKFELGTFTSKDTFEKVYGTSNGWISKGESIVQNRDVEYKESDEYATRGEIIAEWKENDEVDVDKEFDDNIKLGIFRQMFSDESYRKVLEMGGYRHISYD